MKTKLEIEKELDFLTDKLSTQVRTVALGILAFTWGLLIGDSEAAKAISQQWRGTLVVIGALAILALFLDFLQYQAGYMNTKALYDTMESNKCEESQYQKNWAWKLRLICFGAKRLVLAIATLWLFTVVAFWVSS